MNPRTVTVGEMCDLLAGSGREPLSRAALTQFVADGMPKAARGKYDPLACLTWYVARLRTAADRRTYEGDDGKEMSLDQVDIRLKTARARMEEMNVAEREGALVPIDLFEARLTDFVGTVRAGMLNLPARLADQMETLTPLERKRLIKDEIHRALSAVSRRGDEEDELGTDGDSGTTKAESPGKPAGKARKGRAKSVSAA